MEEPTSSLYLGNLAPQVTRRHLYEIGIQAGPVVSVTLPHESTVNKGTVNKGFGFVEYEEVEDAAYAVALFRGNLRLFGREVRVQFGGQPKRSGSGVGPPAGGAQQQQGRSGSTPQGGTEERRQQSAVRSDSGRQAHPAQPPPQQQQQQQQQQQFVQTPAMQLQPQMQHGYLQLQPPAPHSYSFAGMMQAAAFQQQQLHMQQAAAYAHGMTPSPMQQQYGSSPYQANSHAQQYGSSPYQANGQQQPLPPHW
ncbi:splicing factor 3B subunit 4 isoform X1 [Chlorella sorokiniana]|uniref:Splicing factor 3B subunit 4 isoform X1 n=1 Tax=Chlorella sorokiniana TaxID=3076 RepID=A0A2P6U147_CHLSO|nr:splicing factor 3B subunit 4 isoform X1 [Chlorella sorokiniana]|eukprot:PRW60028.1 splicing factor 3B subunit 4 isoform X1 [Chlorella sorokiniana]